MVASRRAKFLGYKSGLCKQQERRESTSSANMLACHIARVASLGEKTFLAETNRKSLVSRHTKTSRTLATCPDVLRLNNRTLAGLRSS